MVQASITSSATLAGINCAGRLITDDDDFDAMSSANSLVANLLDAIPDNPMDALPVVNTEVCFDIWGDYVGDASCLCQVGCARRAGNDADCQAPSKDGSLAGFWSQDGSLAGHISQDASLAH